MTPREFANYSKGFEESFKLKERVEWERQRWLGWLVSRVAGSKLQSPQDLFLLDNERPSVDEQKRRLEAIERKFPKQLSNG